MSVDDIKKRFSGLFYIHVPRDIKLGRTLVTNMKGMPYNINACLII